MLSLLIITKYVYNNYIRHNYYDNDCLTHLINVIIRIM